MFVRVRKLIKQAGFTLIEVIIGITVLSTALIFLTGVLVPQAQKSTDPWFQVRSAELAHSMMNEINSRSFDENSPRTGSSLRCDETGAEDCITSLPLPCPTPTSPPTSHSWSDGQSREDFNDIDDYHCFSATGNDIKNSENGALTDVYSEYTVQVTVVYAGTELGLSNKLAKKITVEVKPPRGVPINYTTYRTNY
jgi:MSHA pilin protein MshD